MVAGSIISVVMRAPMYRTAVTIDEGGYLGVARAWAHGSVLYRDVWIDRPQGLFVLFRMWDWVSGGSTASIRLMAMLFGILLVLATTSLVRTLVGVDAAKWTALVTGVVSAAPVLESYASNGELLSGAVSATSLAIAAWALTQRRSQWWFFLSGVVSGLALGLKQSGFDGLVVVGGGLAFLALFGSGSRRRSLHALVAMACGTALVVGAMAGHGAATGWSRWWFANVGYRLQVESAFASGKWANLRETAPFALAVLGTVVVAASVGTVLLLVRARSRHGEADHTTDPCACSWMLPAWLAASVVAFLIGGGFWRHYWLLLAAPLSALAGVALARARRLAPLALAAVLAPCLVISVWVFNGDHTTLLVRAAQDRRSEVTRRVADWYLANRRPGEHIYGLCSSAALYADAHDDPGYPYLWFTEVRRAPQSGDLLVAYLGDRRRAPQFIARFQSPSACDPSGRVGRILSRDYRPVTTIGGVAVLSRIPSAAQTGLRK